MTEMACAKDECGYEAKLPQVQHPIFGLTTPSYHDLAHLYFDLRAKLEQRESYITALVDSRQDVLNKLAQAEARARVLIAAMRSLGYGDVADVALAALEKPHSVGDE